MPNFADKATYPSLVCDENDTLHIAYRSSSTTPWGLMFQRLPKGGAWSEPIVLASPPAGHAGYGHFHHTLTIARDQALHLAFDIYYGGQWHEIPDAGLNPLPIQRPIPIWFGGHADIVLKRVAYLGDGWMPNYRTADEAKPSIELIELLLHEAGRHRSEIGIEARIKYDLGDPTIWSKDIHEWQAVGATHLSINTMGCGFSTPQQHITAIRKFSSEIIG